MSPFLKTSHNINAEYRLASERVHENTYMFVDNLLVFKSDVIAGWCDSESIFIADATLYVFLQYPLHMSWSLRSRKGIHMFFFHFCKNAMITGGDVLNSLMPSNMLTHAIMVLEKHDHSRFHRTNWIELNLVTRRGIGLYSISITHHCYLLLKEHQQSSHHVNFALNVEDFDNSCTSKLQVSEEKC